MTTSLRPGTWYLKVLQETEKVTLVLKDSR